MKQTGSNSPKHFAVVARDGFFRGSTHVYSAHTTEAAAVKAASKHRVNIPGNNVDQSCAMVIRSNNGGFCKGEVVYQIDLRTLYSVVW